MPSVKITETLSVSEQPELAAFRDFAEEGFSVVVNARPDNEDPGHPGNIAEAAAARAAGLGYAFIPVSGPGIAEADIRAFQKTLSDADGPVLAHCKSGTRALTLYALGEVLDGRMRREDVEGFGKRFGFDLSGAVRWLEREDARKPQVKGFYDARTGSIQYVVSDPATKACAIIDPVLDFDEKSGATATVNADVILDYIDAEGLRVEWILDTHPHADHLSAAFYLKQKTGAPTAIGANVVAVQQLWKDIYNLPDFVADGSQWDRLFEDSDTFKIGGLEGHVMFSPGHTLASITFVVGDAAFVHDTLFMPDVGTARADFPGGSARALWTSIQRILSLPEETRLFTGHDYQPEGRNAKWESTVGEQKRVNPHIARMSESDFVRVREARDRTLPMPKLILHALQVNMCCGRLPEPQDNGRRYLKFPLDALEGAAW
ncbi:bifunctional sulfur transferase/dioxygenase Blh [Agrobacterium rosae]|uniref:Bifunctional sulfur transferase/dioxygenase Blh n=1 Tax=Agrobacterium rosae TaxID=1972867 RepID=A0AAW9FIW2_9HYPH|nr:bifunctional sulfur transferase/dioxygenase Blh [Agrobacterium rosae]MDX8305056.1 bifunctional sulfur transferase/dioxygenase Blh [Agrobacterium rosae]